MQPQPIVSTKVKGPRIRSAVAVFVLGILLVAPGVWKFASSVVDILDGPVYSIPGTVRTHLDSGTYIVFERTGSANSFGPASVTTDHGITLDSTNVTVTDPSGNDVGVRSSVPNETITRGSDRFVAAVEFNAAHAGRYAIHIDVSQPGLVVIQHPLGDIFRKNVPWLLAIVVGGMLAVAGFVMFIVGIVRRGRSPKTPVMVGGVVTTPWGTEPVSPPTAAPMAAPMAAPIAAPTPVPTPVPTPALPPAAWHPDPQGQHRLRYWDGANWTDHTAD